MSVEPLTNASGPSEDSSESIIRPVPNVDPSMYVSSIIGIVKRKCTHDCSLPYCEYAHPNYLDSPIQHPKWCLSGSIFTCHNPKCVFNHFMTVEEFVLYRSRDIAWLFQHLSLCRQYGIDIPTSRTCNGRGH